MLLLSSAARVSLALPRQLDRPLALRRTTESSSKARDEDSVDRTSKDESKIWNTCMDRHEASLVEYRTHFLMYERDTPARSLEDAMASCGREGVGEWCEWGREDIRRGDG